MAEQETTQEQADPAESVASAPSYTRAGDQGETTLGGQIPTDKAAPQIAASGACEEASALLGEVIALGPELPNEMVRILARVQNDLVDVSSDISIPLDAEGTDSSVIRIDEGYVRRLDSACEHFGADLAAPPTVAVPGGTTPAATLFHARTVVRRAERATHGALNSAQINPLTSVYLNRLGSLLLILARGSNVEHGDTLWQPGLTTELGDAELWEPMQAPGES